MQEYVIIVAGGVGKRMGAPLPKQFLELAGRPILMRTIDQFKGARPQINVIVSIHSDYIELWQSLCEKHQFTIDHTLVAGGKERFHSVKAGLDSISAEEGVVGVHDAVRPLVSEKTIQTCFDSASAKGAVVPVTMVFDSIRKVTDAGNKAVNRIDYRIVQTPQCFDLKLIKSAFNSGYREEFTDDASVAEAAGHDINLVEGNRENIKVTTSEDLKIAEAFLAQRTD
ncbi:2-C-methyl-D-erythritol 4-phosphate cytidylyltransferase [Halocola ammonii]